MRSLLVLLVAGAAAAGPGRVPATEFARRVLSRADLVVEGSVAEARPVLRGVVRARIRVSRRLWGLQRASELTVLYLEDAPAPDAFDERVAGGRLAEGETALFFLRAGEGSWSLLNAVPGRDPLYAEKLARLEQILDLERGGAYDLRLARARDVFLAGLSAADPWTRGNSARELAAMARRFPSMFGAETARTVAALLEEEPEAGVREGLEAALAALDPARARALALRAEREETARAADALAREEAQLRALHDPDLKAADLSRIGRTYGRAATGLLGSLLADDAALVRERAAQVLADFGGPSAGTPLLEALAREEDENAASAIVYALGRLREEAAVDSLARRATDPALTRPALEALGRIGGKRARATLERLREGAPEARREWIDRILAEPVLD